MIVARHESRVPTLEWVVSATDAEMLDVLGPEVPCPRCGGMLRQDPLWTRPNLADDQGHTYSNIRALVVELYQRGMLLDARPAHDQRRPRRQGTLRGRAS